MQVTETSTNINSIRLGKLLFLSRACRRPISTLHTLVECPAVLVVCENSSPFTKMSQLTQEWDQNKVGNPWPERHPRKNEHGTIRNRLHSSNGSYESTQTS